MLSVGGDGQNPELSVKALNCSLERILSFLNGLSCYHSSCLKFSKCYVFLKLVSRNLGLIFSLLLLLNECTCKVDGL